MPESAADATEILQRLFRVPPPEFVAERNKIAKALKADGEKDLAAAVSAVRRPGVSDWALDVTAAEHADDVAELVEAAREVLDAQEAAMDGRDSGDLRIRLKLLRVCTATVANLASGVAARSGQTGSGSSAADITTRLTEIAGNRNALDLLERGLLGAEDPGAADPFGIAADGTATRRATKRVTTAKAAERSPAPEEPAGRTAAERKRLRDEVAHTQKALSAAESAAETARRAVAKQETALAKAEARVADAEARLEALKADVTAATDALESAREDAESADHAANEARAALDAAERAMSE